MHARTTAAALLAAALALTACTSTGASTAPATAEPPPTTSTAPSRADLIRQCADAIQAGRDDAAGAPECTSLPLDDYYDALREANQRGRDELQRRLDDAAEQDAQ